MARKARSNDDLVIAGAGAEGHGVMAGFGGDGPLTRDVLLDLARRSTIDEAWFPAAKDARVQLSRAMQSVASKNGMSAEIFKKKNRQTVELRDWTSCIAMVASNGMEAIHAGEAFGTVAFVATLFDDEQGQELIFDVPDHPLALAVRAEYERLTGAQLYQAADVTSWLSHIHRDMLGGVRLGFGWYVPRANRAVAEQIAQVFWEEARYGERWICPPLPVATSAQLQVGIANGLSAEVDEQLALLEGQRRTIRRTRGGFNVKGVAQEGGEYNEAGERVDIGARAAESFAVRFARVAHRIRDYAAQLSLELVSQCEMRIHDAMVEVDHALEGGATTPDGRFRNLLDEADAREREANDADDKARNETNFARVLDKSKI